MMEGMSHQALGSQGAQGFVGSEMHQDFFSATDNFSGKQVPKLTLKPEAFLLVFLN